MNLVIGLFVLNYVIGLILLLLVFVDHKDPKIQERALEVRVLILSLHPDRLFIALLVLPMLVVPIALYGKLQRNRD